MLDGAKKHFVFGYMRLPMNGDEVDIGGWRFSAADIML